VDVVCASMPLGYDEYVKSIGDENLVIDMMAEDIQRIIECATRGFTVRRMCLLTFSTPISGFARQASTVAR
jgi:hypothetical protein